MSINFVTVTKLTVTNNLWLLNSKVSEAGKKEEMQ